MMKLETLLETTAQTFDGQPESQKQLIQTVLNPEQGAVWCYLNARPKSCFTLELLDEIGQLQGYIEQRLDYENRNHIRQSIRHQVLASNTPGIFSFGGDLHNFVHYIRNKDRAGMHHYMQSCIDVLCKTASGYNGCVNTISLIQGDALGGGFESALAAETIIAEKSVKMGFPETLFNMFPGMGAFQLLTQRVSPALAKKIITSGRLYVAQELSDMGIIDILVEDGHGVRATEEFISRSERYWNTRKGLLKVTKPSFKKLYTDLMEVGEIWVDAAMDLNDSDLKLMLHLVQGQEKRTSKTDAV